MKRMIKTKQAIMQIFPFITAESASSSYRSIICLYLFLYKKVKDRITNGMTNDIIKNNGENILCGIVPVIQSNKIQDKHVKLNDIPVTIPSIAEKIGVV